MIVLRTENVTLNFDGVRALEDVTIAVNEGDLLGLIGPNGAGKTTLFNVITGFLEPTSGSIFFGEKKISGLPPHKIAQSGIVRTFQITNIFHDVTCLENIVIGQHLKIKGDFLSSLIQSRKYRKQKKHVEKKASEIIEFIGMGDKGKTIASNLPYGDQRKLEIGIALAADPKIILLDEPGCGLNPQETGDLINLIKSIHDNGLTVMIVEHNMKIVMELCERICVLEKGKLLCEGDPEFVCNNEDVISCYLGEKRK